MNLSALQFFKSLRPNNRQFAVIGLGRFGRAVSATLHNLGYEVLGIDSDEKRVDQALCDEIASHVLQLDAMQPSALREAGVFEFDTVIVAIGNYIQESIITTLNLKEGGVPHIVAKASSEIHGKLLERVGADHVVFPEHEMGCELARSLTRPGILERFEVDPDHSIVEVVVPKAFDGKTLLELDLRSRYGLNVIAVGHEDSSSQINPSPATILHKDMILVVIGSNKGINQLPV
ncbi:potassium channel family protein [Vacuolonema iberomarrocanum]|uniref:potassium channel family protein n=1 Tax=Vacuolonema iberomarrocanum TaxID=3454632 RepID=UPI0019E8CE4C|nr:TrkA family potassium uptake protein [filamentous cyanobacterium LEGE 07170]